MLSPVISSGNLIILQLTFRSVMHLELFFVKDGSLYVEIFV